MYHSKNIDVDPDEMEHGNMYDELMERLISDAGNLFKIGLAKIIIENNYSETSKTKIQMNYQHQLNESKKLKKSPLIKLLLCQKQCVFILLNLSIHFMGKIILCKTKKKL